MICLCWFLQPPSEQHVTVAIFSRADEDHQSGKRRKFAAEAPVLMIVASALLSINLVGLNDPKRGAEKDSNHSRLS